VARRTWGPTDLLTKTLGGEFKIVTLAYGQDVEKTSRKVQDEKWKTIRGIVCIRTSQRR
jgi:hypothetical protein